jgi:dTDP-4-dehydrorhamnose 3,5-epimerase
VVHGRVWDVAVDIRAASPTFGRWVGVELTETNHRQLWIPEGFAHGFLSLEDGTEFLYKTTDVYAKDCERSIRWDDLDLKIEWPLAGLAVSLAPKDASAPLLAQAQHT